MFLFETFSRMYHDMERESNKTTTIKKKKQPREKLFQMSTMSLGVVRNNEELVSHNI